jgi:hypothetical protein
VNEGSARRWPATALALVLLSCTGGAPTTTTEQVDPSTPSGPAEPTDPVAAELARYIENVTDADGRHYRVEDDRGNQMSTLKVIESAPAGGFIAVYFTYVGEPNGPEFEGHLATSVDLLRWSWVRSLGDDANQPTIRAVGEGYLVAWEQGPENYLRLERYPDWPALRDGVPDRAFDAPRTLTPCSEGTPNIYAANESAVDVGFHYHWNCDVDRQARGTLSGWADWRADPQPGLDAAVLAHGIRGNVGDRDGVLTFGERQFTIIEGQHVRDDFDSWRVFLYEHASGTAWPLLIRTDRGSRAFGNPTFEIVQLDGRRALVVTLFVFDNFFGEGGPLLYYRYF